MLHGISCAQSVSVSVVGMRNIWFCIQKLRWNVCAHVCCDSLYNNFFFITTPSKNYHGALMSPWIGPFLKVEFGFASEKNCVKDYE